MSIKSLTDTLITFDFFAKPVNLTFQGQDKFKTPIGAIFTFFCSMLVLAYGVFRFWPILTDQNTILTKSTMLVNNENEFFSQKREWSQGAQIKPKVYFAFGVGTKIMPTRMGKFQVR